METRPAQKSLLRQILALSIPASMEMVFQMLLGLIDSVFVSHLGEASLASVSIINQIVFLLLLTLGTIGVGGNILIAQYYGKNDGQMVSRLAGQVIALGLGLSVVAALVLTFGYHFLFRTIGAEPEVIVAGETFFKIIMMSMPISFAGTLIAGVLRAVGDAHHSMISNSIGIVVNTLLNYVLIFGVSPFPQLGISGAAWATLIARCVSTGIIAIYFLRFSKRLHFQPSHLFFWSRSLLQRVTRLSLPVTIGEAAWAAGAFGYTVLYTQIDTASVVANQIVFNVEELFIMFSFGMTVAGLTLVGQEIGAQNIDLMQQKAKGILRVGFATSIIFGLLLAAASRFIGMVYPKVPTGVLQVAAFALCFNAVIQPIKVANFILGNGILKGGGDTRFVMSVDCFVVFFIGLPGAYVLSQQFALGFYGVLMGKALEEAARFSLMMARYRSDKWFRFLAN